MSSTKRSVIGVVSGDGAAYTPPMEDRLKMIVSRLERIVHRVDAVNDRVKSQGRGGEGVDRPESVGLHSLIRDCELLAEQIDVITQETEHELFGNLCGLQEDGEPLPAPTKHKSR